LPPGAFCAKSFFPFQDFHMTRFKGRAVVPFDELRMDDVDVVGGKNASLGEMISQLAASGVRVPGGFATTAEAFRNFLEENDLTRRIAEKLERLNTEDVKALAECGATIRQWIVDAPLPRALEAEIREHYERTATEIVPPDASFAGQQ